MGGSGAPPIKAYRLRRGVRRETLATKLSFPTRQPSRSLLQPGKSSIEMLSHSLYVVGFGGRQAATIDEIRNGACECIRGIVDELRVIDQIEADLRANRFIIAATGHLTEAAADEHRAIIRPGPVPIAAAVDVVDQLEAKIRIACE